MYEVQSPRYLSSALGTGYERCEQALQFCVHDFVQCAQYHALLNMMDDKKRYEDHSVFVVVFTANSITTMVCRTGTYLTA